MRSYYLIVRGEQFVDATLSCMPRDCFAAYGAFKMVWHSEKLRRAMTDDLFIGCYLLLLVHCPVSRIFLMG
jgi:hypothetical protein